VVSLHRPLTRFARRGERRSVEMAGDSGCDPLMAVTICETARAWAGSAIGWEAVDHRALASSAAALAEAALLGIVPAEV
jgi:hypothetical protein